MMFNIFGKFKIYKTQQNNRPKNERFFQRVADSDHFNFFIAILTIACIVLALPNVGPAENIRIVLTPERIARGKYLANNVALCMDCHSQRDWSKPFGAIAERI